MKLNKTLISKLITGSTLYGCGGGGDPTAATRLLETIVPKNWPSLKTLDQIKPTGVIMTGYTVGGLTDGSIDPKLIMSGLKIMESRLKQPIVGIVPVEIGPLSLALAIKVASILKLPIIDADFVGGRSTPEVFLETITLFDVPRTPIFVGDTMGNQAILETSSTAQAEELFLRQFCIISNAPALVLGYPISPKVLKGKVVEKTVSQAINAGAMILDQSLLDNLSKINGKLIGKGIITAINQSNTGGFTNTVLNIKTTNSNVEIIAKNENLIVMENDQPILTCPDLIALCDQSGNPLYNTCIKINDQVSVVGIKAPSMWRTKQGLKLFSPQLFSPIKQSVLLD